MEYFSETTYNRGVINLILCLILIFITYKLFKFAIYCFAKNNQITREKGEDYYKNRDGFYFITGIFVISFVVLASIYALCVLPDSLKHIINPQYYAMTDLLNYLPGIK